VIGRIVRSVDFERVLRCPPRARSTHFALHHLAGVPTPPAKPLRKRESQELSTGEVPTFVAPVDDSSHGTAPAGPRLWLGMVIPKRHARRSVTRSLLKRQIRAAIGRSESLLGSGLWVVRLRSPFDRASFPAAASAALGDLAGEELATLIQRAG
jgi:ribonuclease P protein component